LAIALTSTDDVVRDPAGAAARRAHAARYSWQACAEATVAAYRKARDWPIAHENLTCHR
jgi:glycosyltransferase involved in cell wall biosynthesis